MKDYHFRQASLVFLFLASVGLTQSRLVAQVDRGEIVGTVSDSSGAVVPEATVEAISKPSVAH